jgi:hypothetical protein
VSWKPVGLSIAALAFTVSCGALAVRGATGPLALSIQTTGLAVWALHFHRKSDWKVKILWLAIIWLTLVVSFGLTSRPLNITILLATASWAGCTLGYVTLTKGLQVNPSLAAREDLSTFTYAFLVCISTVMTLGFLGALIMDAGPHG